MQKVTTYLWFDEQAEDAAKLYTSLLKGSKILETMPGGPNGKPLVVVFELAGQRFMALNGGPQFTFNEAMSLFVDCEDQAEVDRLWKALTANGGEESQCGWLKDRFGVSWQIVPRAFMDMMGSSDKEKSGRAMNAMLKMKKMDVAALERAFEGR